MKRNRLARGASIALLLAAIVGTFGTSPSLSAAAEGGREGEPRARRKVTPTIYSIGHASGEPTIGITRAGGIFTSAIQDNTRVLVLRSGDRGRSWEDVSPKLGDVNAHLLSFDPYTHVDPKTSRLFTIDLTVACSYLSYSDDEGETWTTDPLACGRPVNDHQTLFAGKPTVSRTSGYPNVVYYCFNDTLNSACSKSLDGGLTFVPTGAPAFLISHEDETACSEGLHGHGHAARDGTLLLPRGYCGQPWLAISRNEGMTWKRIQVANNGIAHHEASVGSDREGNIYYAWVAADRLPYLAISRDGGETWSRPLRLAAPGMTETNLPSLVTGSPGRVAIAYMGSADSPFAVGQPASECSSTCTTESEDYAGVTWHAYVTVVKDALGTRPRRRVIQMNPADDPLKRGRCGPGRCGAVMDFIDIQIDERGQPWVALVDACTGSCVQNFYDEGNEGLVGTLEGVDLTIRNKRR